MPDRIISHYRIIEKLGEGGMGVVYKAEDTALKRTVALKFLSPGPARTGEAGERFVHEAQAAASLNHPNICTIHEIDRNDGDPFIAMEYIDGPSLRETIESGPLKIDDAVNITLQAADGLAAAHEKGIVHRDIKSSNIMIADKQKVKLMDFGLAKSIDRTQLTREGTTLGTAAYMSPEQAQVHSVDHRSDIWSLGVVMYEMISGRQPFAGEYEHAVVYSIINTEPESLTSLRTCVPIELERIVSRCLAKDPSERYQTARDLAADLQRFQRIGSSGGWQSRVNDARARRSGGGPFQKPMSRWLWFLLISIPAIAFLITQVLVPRYFSADVNRGGEGRKMLAVLPFENLGPPGEEYFADGITEELIARLARNKGLGVIARTSVMRYKGSDRSIEQIGDELEVDYILEGTIRWQRLSETHSRVRITPQLIRVSDETHLWAEVYQRDMTDIFIVQDEIAGRVASSLDIRLLDPGEKGRAPRNPTSDIDAYRAYLEGRFWWNKRSMEGFDRAIELFDEAIEIDPGYALAYAGKAECYCMLAVHVARPAEYLESARTAAKKALELDDSLAGAHSALGWVATVYDYDYASAERSFLRAIELDPGYATALNWYGVMLAWTGRGEDGIAQLLLAHQLDPASMIIGRDLGCALSWVGRMDDAIEQLENTIAMDPDFTPAHAHLGRIYAAQGKYDEALAEFEVIRKIDGEYFNLDMMLGYTYAKAGRREESLRILEKLTASYDTSAPMAFGIALVHAGLGNIDEAFEWLEESAENREFGMILIGVHIWTGDLRGDRRYEALRGKIGLQEVP
jgi:serine/threonine-protein kinase